MTKSDATLIAGSLAEGGGTLDGARYERFDDHRRRLRRRESRHVMGLLHRSGCVRRNSAGRFEACRPEGVRSAIGCAERELAVARRQVALPSRSAKSLCNDMVVGSDGTVYVADSFQPHVLALAPGATALTVWAESSLFRGDGPQRDGVTIAGDGNM